MRSKDKENRKKEEMKVGRKPSVRTSNPKVFNVHQWYLCLDLPFFETRYKIQGLFDLILISSIEVHFATFLRRPIMVKKTSRDGR